MRYFDSHAHYWDKRFSAEYEGGADVLLTRLFAENVSYIVNVGTSPETSRLAIAQAQRFPRMYVAAGIHPTDLADIADMHFALGEIEALLKNADNKIVAIGEIGLDYYWEPYDKERQKEFFAAQMQLAQRYRLPVVIHDREAHGDCFDMACAFPCVHGVFHSYSGSAEMAKDLVRRGYMISFSGTISFKNAVKVREVAAALPQDRVLIETDCPYLSPHPFRGKLNHSGLLPYTCAALAEAWGISTDEAARITDANARAFFRIAD